jgi:hypothetical protein
MKSAEERRAAGESRVDREIDAVVGLLALAQFGRDFVGEISGKQHSPPMV